MANLLLNVNMLPTLDSNFFRFLWRGLLGWTLTFLGVFLDSNFFWRICLTFFGESAAECEYAGNFTDVKELNLNCNILLTWNVSNRKRTHVSVFMIRCPRSLSSERIEQTRKFNHYRCRNGSINCPPRPRGSGHQLVVHDIA